MSEYKYKLFREKFTNFANYIFHKILAIQILILLGGLLLILLGANYLVDGSSSIAKRYGLSEFVIGLTIVGIGTSSPEMVVSFMSAIQGKADMAIGNVAGSNIFNTLMILGITALISPLVITKNNLKKDIPLNILVTALLIILGMNFTFFGIGDDVISRFDGALLLGIFAWYMWSSFKSDNNDEDEENEGIVVRNMPVSILMVTGGLAALIIGGRLFVNSATALAQMFGVSDKFIAITVMAAGTSMPELATCAVAAFKGRGQLALGNILGSNISNILLILGGSALITPLSFSGMTSVDIGVLMLCSILILLSAYIFDKKKIDRIEGTIFLLVQIAYMWYLISNL